MSNRNRDYEIGPYEEEYRGFEIRDDETARGPLILTLAIGVLIVFAAVVWNTYRQGVRPQDGALPMVVAENQPYKRVPDDRGGVEIDDLDRRIYDVMDGNERPPEATRVSSRAEGYLQGGPPMDLRPSSDGTPAGSSAQNAPEEAEQQVAEAGAGALEPVASELPALPEKPAAEGPASADPDTPAEPGPAVSEPESRFAFDSSGDYLVQISALRSEEAATEAWKKARRSNPSIFRGANMSIERADLGAKGVFFRLRAGAFSSRDSASDFCDAYKAEGGDCIVVRETA